MVNTERLRSARRRAGYDNASAFAREVGVSPTTIYRIESGLVQPSVETLRKWAEVSACTSDYLLGLTNDPQEVAA